MPSNSLTNRLNFLSRIAIIIIGLILITFFLKQTNSISSTIFTGMILGLVFVPINRYFFEKLHIPLALSVLFTMILFLVISFLFIILLYTALSSVSEYFDFYRNRITIIIDSILFNVSNANINLDFLDELQDSIFTFLRNTVFSLSTRAINIGKDYLLITIALMFTIIEFSWIKEKTNLIFSNDKKEKILDDFFEETSRSISKFMLLKTLISLCTGSIIYFSFVMIGVNFPLLWAFLTFLLNFIPSVGSLIISVISILFSILQFYPSWTEVILITVIILLTQSIIGNIIDPSITGDSLNLSALVILIGLVYWGYVWGILGMLLSVPLLVLIRTMCKHIPYLHKLSILLGNGSTISRMRKKQEAKENSYESKPT